MSVASNSEVSSLTPVAGSSSGSPIVLPSTEAINVVAGGAHVGSAEAYAPSIAAGGIVHPNGETGSATEASPSVLGLVAGGALAAEFGPTDRGGAELLASVSDGAIVSAQEMAFSPPPGSPSTILTVEAGGEVEKWPGALRPTTFEERFIGAAGVAGGDGALSGAMRSELGSAPDSSYSERRAQFVASGAAVTSLLLTGGAEAGVSGEQSDLNTTDLGAGGHGS